MRIEDTAGNVTYTIPYCDCGLTGGCEKCQPIYLPRQGYVEYKPSPRFDRNEFYEGDIFPVSHEERFLDPNLEAFYRKKGYI